MTSAWKFTVGCCFAIAAFGPVGAVAQEEGGLVGGIPLQFSLVPPGARSLGLGGAFIGAANDATAAWSNPAGLMNLLQPEVSLEFRHVATAGGKERFSVQGGRFDATEVGFEYEDGNEFSFASWVLPKERWALALYYHELAAQSASGSSTPCQPEPECGGQVGGARFRFDSDLRVEIPGVGASLAVKVSENWRFGLGVSYYQLDLSSRYSSLNRGTNSTRRVKSDDKALGGVAGVQWRNEVLSVGAVYRMGPDFETNSRRLCGGFSRYSATPETYEPSERCGSASSGFFPSEQGASFKVPDSYGLGLAWQATSEFSIAVDVVHTEYSALSDVQTLNDSTKLVEYVVDDTTEPHLGLEYVFKLAEARFLNLRAGAWMESDHRLRYPRPAGFDPSVDRDVAVTIDRMYPSEKADEEIHTTLGLGLTLGLRFQLDLAFDLSGLTDTASLSGVYRF